MSTNPFRQIKFQQQQESERSIVPSAHFTAPDDSGSTSQRDDLYLNTNVQSFDTGDRHVSFASPPVDRTITAVSYPSSPESARSPPIHAIQPATPNYRTAFLRDPFEDLRSNTGEDKIIQEAQHNAQTNADATQVSNTQSGQDAVMQTLGRFAPSRRPSSTSKSNPSTAPPVAAPKQSLDVDAFTRLLLTGDSHRGDSSMKQSAGVFTDNASSTDTNSVSQSSLFDTPGQFTEATPRSSHDNDRVTDDVATKAPPPAPAPRRAKSVKLKEQTSKFGEDNKEHPLPPPRASLTPPAPPVARRAGQHITAENNEDKTQKQIETEPRVESVTAGSKLVPPPPPIRKQHSISHRSPSTELTSTTEESGQLPLITSSRRSSADRPPAPPSRNSSASIKRQSMGVMQPPPLPPARRGQDSSRNSMDSFRPSLSSIMGDDGQENPLSGSAIRQTRNLTPSSADSILAELANLQKEVDAARRTS